MNLGVSQHVSQAEPGHLVTHTMSHFFRGMQADREGPQWHQEPYVSALSRVSWTDLNVLRRLVGGPTRSHKVAQIDWIAMTLTKELFPVTVKVTAKPATLRPDSEVGIQRCYRAAAHLTPARHPQERLNRLALPGLGMRAALSHSPERAIPHPRASSAPSSSTPFDMFEVSCKAGRSRAHRHT